MTRESIWLPFQIPRNRQSHVIQLRGKCSISFHFIGHLIISTPYWFVVRLNRILIDSEFHRIFCRYKWSVNFRKWNNEQQTHAIAVLLWRHVWQVIRVAWECTTSLFSCYFCFQYVDSCVFLSSIIYQLWRQQVFVPTKTFVDIHQNRMKSVSPSAAMWHWTTRKWSIGPKFQLTKFNICTAQPVFMASSSKMHRHTIHRQFDGNLYDAERIANTHAKLFLFTFSVPDKDTSQIRMKSIVINAQVNTHNNVIPSKLYSDFVEWKRPPLLSMLESQLKIVNSLYAMRDAETVCCCSLILIFVFKCIRVDSLRMQLWIKRLSMCVYALRALQVFGRFDLGPYMYWYVVVSEWELMHAKNCAFCLGALLVRWVGVVWCECISVSVYRSNKLCLHSSRHEHLSKSPRFKQ